MERYSIVHLKTLRISERISNMHPIRIESAVRLHHLMIPLLFLFLGTALLGGCRKDDIDTGSQTEIIQAMEDLGLSSVSWAVVKEDQLLWQHAGLIRDQAGLSTLLQHQGVMTADCVPHQQAGEYSLQLIS